MVALLASGCLLRAKRGETPVTGEIHIVGARSLTEKEIIDRLALSPSGRWLLGLTDAHPFDLDALPADAKRIERIYQAFGFYRARVLDSQFDEHDGRVDVTFRVEEGPVTRVAERRLEGLAPLPEDVRRRVLEGLPLSPGAPLVEDEYDRLKVELRERLRNQGYIDAKLEGRATVDREKSTAVVSLEVSTGDRMRIGRIFVSGAQGISRDRVSLTSGLEAGQLITPEALQKAQRSVYAMGVFNLVQVDPAAPEAPGVAPVVITVHEAPFIVREVGLGVVTDPTRWVGQVRGLWQHKNVARGLQQLTLSGSLGYAVLPSVPAWLFGDGLTGSGIVGDAKVEYLQPRVWRTPFDVAASLDYTKDVTNAFEYQRAGLKLAFPVHLDMVLNGTTLTTSFAYDYYFRVSQHDAIPVGSTSSFATSGCGSPTGATAASDQCVIGYVEERLTIDRRDSPISAHKGWYLTASAQYAGLPGSQFDYLRLFPEARAYLPITERTTLALRGRWGMLFSFDGGQRDLPGVAKFFAGGANSVRVAGAQQLGPRDFLVVDNPDASKAGRDPYTAGAPLPLGGNRLVEGSVELRMPTPWESMGWVLFADAGAVSNVDPTSRGFWPGTEFLRYGAGVGLRVHTPVGPIRIDLAQRLLSWSETPNSVRTNLSGGAAAAQAFIDRSNNPPYRSRPPVPAGQPETPLASEYRLSTSCKGAGYPTQPGDAGYDTQFHKCFSEGGYLSGIQFFLTIGEAF